MRSHYLCAWKNDSCALCRSFHFIQFAIFFFDSFFPVPLWWRVLSKCFLIYLRVRHYCHFIRNFLRVHHCCCFYLCFFFLFDVTSSFNFYFFFVIFWAIGAIHECIQQPTRYIILLYKWIFSTFTVLFFFVKIIMYAMPFFFIICLSRFPFICYFEPAFLIQTNSFGLRFCFVIIVVSCLFRIE